MEQIKLTVYFSTYNQESYVAEALDSILMQKTDFSFEIVAADDCSSDRTQEIILDYQKRYPDQIVTYFPAQNLGGCQKLMNCIDNGLLRGEYLSFLEGDDYWLDENRLRTLVDFLDAHPEYSRVSHRRKVIDENGNDKGFDIPETVLEKPFTIDDFLLGKNYSDFGSVFRNYFKLCGNKYHELFRASRNVCDFQDMFITQDFGPVYVMDAVYGVYRSRSVAGATNYNSTVTFAGRSKENIRLAQAVMSFYGGKYDLTPMIRHNQKRLFAAAIRDEDKKAFADALAQTLEDDSYDILAELLYLALRGGRKQERDFVRAQLCAKEWRSVESKCAKYIVVRLKEKFTKTHPDEKLRGYRLR